MGRYSVNRRALRQTGYKNIIGLSYEASLCGDSMLGDGSSGTKKLRPHTTSSYRELSLRSVCFQIGWKIYFGLFNV
jgi:hypothetical protein